MKNKRLISDEEIELLLDFSQTPETKWEILLGSSDDTLCSFIEDLFSEDDRINLNVVSSGCETLIVSGMEPPHLIIIDDELPDLPAGEAIKCIKGKEELKEIKVLYCVNSEKGIDWNRQEVDDYFVKNYIDREYISKKVLSLLYASDHEPVPRGRWPRMNVSITAKLELSSITDPDMCIHGLAQVENISRTGAYLTKIKLDRELNLDDTFRVRLKIDKKPLKDWKAESVIVRLKTDNTAGVKFISLSKKDKMKIANINI